MKKKITLKEIAKKCGVSTATVSFVINIAIVFFFPINFEYFKILLLDK